MSCVQGVLGDGYQLIILPMALSIIISGLGYDGNKKIKGRKRFTLVDTMGLLIAVSVIAASVPEREGAKKLF